MSRLKRWLIERYFPAEAKETIARLRRELAEKEAELQRLNVYIDGMWDMARLQRKVTIHNEVSK